MEALNTSLAIIRHASAMNVIIKYFITKHSEAMLGALPSGSRIYLHKEPNGVHVITGVTAAQASSLMSGGHLVALHVLVEDDIAQALLAELVRRLDPNFLQTLRISKVGDHDAVRAALRALKQVGVRAAAVLDGDQPSTPKDDVFTLPGDHAPEKELAASRAVKECVAGLGRNLDDFVCSRFDKTTQDGGWDVKTYPARLIEVDLPIKRISAHARREKAIRHGHISTLHIWWAEGPWLPVARSSARRSGPIQPQSMRPALKHFAAEHGS